MSAIFFSMLIPICFHISSSFLFFLLFLFSKGKDGSIYAQISQRKSNRGQTSIFNGKNGFKLPMGIYFHIVTFSSSSDSTFLKGSLQKYLIARNI